MKITRGAHFTADRPWGALDIANMSGITVRLHWAHTPYQWHINDGEEVFVVLHGLVRMLYKEGAMEREAVLHPGDIFFAAKDTEHAAHPVGEARILVIERQGSI